MRDLDCRWISCDEHFKYSECLLKKAYIDALYDKFEELGFSHPFFSSQIPCNCDHTNICPFENSRDASTGIKSNDLEIDEEEAKKRAADAIAQKSNDDIKTTYNKCACSWMLYKLKLFQTEMNDLQKIVEELAK